MFKIVRQHDIKDCGPACLSMICKNYKLFLPLAKLRELVKTDDNGTSVYGIVKGAEKLGLCAKALKGSVYELTESIKNGNITPPFIARVIVDNILEHYVVIYKVTDKHFYIADPAKGLTKCDLKNFLKIWTGQVITFKKTANFKESNELKDSFKRFISLISNQKKEILLIFIISFFISILGICGTFLFKLLIDGIELRSNSIFDINDVGKICIGAFGLYFLKALIEILRGSFLAELTKQSEIALMLKYYNHIMDLGVKDIANRKTGEFLSRFSDASNIVTVISGTAISLIMDSFIIIFCTVFLFLLNKTLFIVIMIMLVLYVIINIFFINPLKNINEKIMETNADVTSYIKETLDGAETIKAFGAENFTKEKTKDKFNALVNAIYKEIVIYTRQGALSNFMASVGGIALLWYGSLLMLDNNITIGVLFAFYTLIGYLLEPLQRLVDIQPQIQSALIAVERLNDILDLDTEKDSDDEISQNNIKINNLYFRYGNRKLVIENLNMEIHSGETIALIGESGSGKTTIAKLIMAFYQPEKGGIFIGGLDISNLNPKTVRKKISYISQDIFFFSDSIKNNLTLGNKNISMHEIENVCKLCKIDDFINKLPNRYDTLIGENGYGLSGGQKQRLAIARALLKKPKILIMDEATSNLDTVTEQSIKELIQQIDGTITCIIIAHRLSTVKDCDKIYVMQEGKIAEYGNHEELIKKGGLYYDFYNIN